MKKGYTLLELVMAISLLVVVLTAGTGLFFRSIKSSGVSDIQTNVNDSLRSLDGQIEQELRYGSVRRVIGLDDSVYTRTECVEAGDAGVTGNSLVSVDNIGSQSAFMVDKGIVYSNPGSEISNPNIYVTKLQFIWYCHSGINDKINLQIEATSSANTGEGFTGRLEKDINLLNSGIN